MGLNDTSIGNRLHIGIFGMCNAGKSSLMNALIGQDLAVVSKKKGTTTDPVTKTMELLPLGPIMLMDTPGIDDIGELGELRKEKTIQILKKIDFAILVIDALIGLQKEDQELLAYFEREKVPNLLVYNKCDLLDQEEKLHKEAIYISTKTNMGLDLLKEQMILRFHKHAKTYMIGDLLKPFDMVVLVVPIDEAAPKDRLILPQQMAIREILEAGASCIVTKDLNLKETLDKLKQPPDLVITDSQVFSYVHDILSDDILLTSFSILMARKKGFLGTAVKALNQLDKLQDGDKILIAEGCTHHRQCGDIGTVKLPNWILNYTKKKVEFVFASGQSFPENLKAFKLVIHCGGCMQTDKEIKNRMKSAKMQEVPFTNYGTLIAYMNGILKRSIEPFLDFFDSI